MRFESKTEEQIAAEGLIPEGWHEAEVIAAEEAVSKKGNEMIVLTLKLYTPQGERQRKDWLLPSFPKKLKHFCDAAGLSDRYKLGNVEAGDCFGKLVMCEIVHEEQKNGEYAGQMQAQVSDYRAVERKSAAAAQSRVGPKPGVSKAPPAAIAPEDIPFSPYPD